MPALFRRALIAATRLPVALWLAAPGVAAPAASTHASELTVSAAASLTNVFRELAAVFEAQNPNSRVLLNFAASGALLQQIEKGAPVDVFASADQETMDRAQARSRIDASRRRNFASNSLVVIVPIASGTVPGTLEDLARGPFARIAIGLPASVPVGRYTRSVLEQAGLWQVVEPRLIAAQNVRQALDYVARGEVDAGFVYATDAALMPDKVRVALTAPSAVPILYPIAPIADTANTAAANKFVDFVLSPPAQAVLAKHGFGKP